MDRAFERRRYRIRHAARIKDTSMQWDLIAAAVDEAVIQVFKLTGKDAT